MSVTNKDEHLKKAMIEALGKTLGVVTTACIKAGVGRTTFYKWCKEDPEFKDQVDDIDNMALDFAESQLHKQIRENNTAATIFFLKTKGKKRGYTEKTTIEHEGSEEKPLNIINLGAGIKPKEKE